MGLSQCNENTKTYIWMSLLKFVFTSFSSCGSLSIINRGRERRCRRLPLGSQVVCQCKEVTACQLLIINDVIMDVPLTSRWWFIYLVTYALSRHFTHFRVLDTWIDILPDGKTKTLTSTYTPLQLLWYWQLGQAYFILWRMLHGELRRERWCNRSASQRASSQYVIGHGHVTYAPFID